MHARRTISDHGPSRTTRIGEEVIGYAFTIKMRALARLGELLKELEKQAGGRGLKGGGRNRGSKKELQFDSPPTLAELGVSKKVVRASTRHSVGNLHRKTELVGVEKIRE